MQVLSYTNEPYHHRRYWPEVYEIFTRCSWTIAAVNVRIRRRYPICYGMQARTMKAVSISAHFGYHSNYSNAP